MPILGHQHLAFFDVRVSHFIAKTVLGIGALTDFLHAQKNKEKAAPIFTKSPG